MKKLLILSIGLLLLAGCNKDECAVCTVVRTSSIAPEVTERHSQSDDGECEESLAEYREGIDANAELEDLNQINTDWMNSLLTGIGGDATVTHTTTCVYE